MPAPAEFSLQSAGLRIKWPRSGRLREHVSETSTESDAMRDLTGKVVIVTGAAGGIGAALTRAIPFNRLGQPDDLAGAVCFLVNDDAAFITD